jgi:hypothetical protein
MNCPVEFYKQRTKKGTGNNKTCRPGPEKTYKSLSVRLSIHKLEYTSRLKCWQAILWFDFIFKLRSKLGIILYADSNIIPLVIVVFIGFHCTDEYPDGVKAAKKPDSYKNRRCDNSKNFLEYPDKRTKAYQQKANDKKSFCVTF